jgi:hypothetical protein
MTLDPVRPSRKLVTFALGMAFLAACTRMPEPVLVRDPRPQPVPLRIGVYNSPEFQDFTYKHHLTDIRWVLGKPSVRLFNEALALLFVEVVEVSAPDSTPNLRSDLAGTIAPRIVSAEAVYRSGEVVNVGTRVLQVQPVRVTYGFTLYSRSGKPEASWEVTGRGREPVDDDGAIKTLKRNFERAIAEGARKLVNEFRDVPEVRQWLANQGVPKG